MAVSKAVQAMNKARIEGNYLKAERALKTALKRGGVTKCDAYKLLVEMWEAQIAKAIEGNTESAKLIIERLDGKPKQQIDANVNVNHAFEQVLIEGRARIADKEQAEAINHQPSESVPISTEVVDPLTLRE